MKQRKHLLFSGVLILTLSNLLVKVIGLMFKIPLQSILTDEGMGYFNAAYSLYVWFYTLSTAGLPIAVSILVSEERTRGGGSVKRIFRLTMALLVGVGGSLSLFMALGASWFASWIDSPSTAAAIAVIAPSLLCAGISGGIRGYYQGCGNMTPTAISQVLEALGKLVLGIAFSLYALRAGLSLPLVSAYAIAGITVGSGLSAIFLLLRKAFGGYGEIQIPPHATVTPTPQLLRSLLRRAVPITVSSSVMSLTNLIDVMIVIRCLRATGLTEDAAQAVYGNYTTLAVPLFNLAPVLIYPIAYALVPALSAARAKGELARAKRLRNTALHSAAILILPCAVGISVMASPILSLFFAEASVELAAPLLSILALSMISVAMLSVTNACLQAEGRERLPIYSMLAGAGVKLLLSFLLIRIPAVGIYGTPVGTFFCYLVIVSINFVFLYQTTGSLPPILSLFGKPALSALACAAAAVGGERCLSLLMPKKLATLLAIGIAALVYVILLLLLRGITEEELQMLPMGEKLLSLLQKFPPILKCRGKSFHQTTEELNNGRRTNQNLPASAGPLHDRGSAAPDAAASDSRGMPVGSGTDPREHP